MSGNTSRRSPRLATPRNVGQLARRREALRSLVELKTLERDLKATFGLKAFEGKLDKASVRPAEQIAIEWSVRRTTERGSTRPPIRHWSSGTTDFARHIDVSKAVNDLVEECLPFGPSGINLPAALQRDLTNLERFEAWVFDASLEGSPLTSDVFAVGIALALTARVYLADVTAALVGTALPLHRLYEESHPAIDQPISLVTPIEPKYKPQTAAAKSLYNAYMAVGLLEALTGQPMPHPDPGSDGYLKGDLRDTFSVAAFKKFWGTDGARHAKILTAIEQYLQKPVLRRAFKGNKKEPPKDLPPMTYGELRTLMLGHGYSRVRIPLPPPGSEGARSDKARDKAATAKPGKKAAEPKPAKPPDDKFGHLVTHLQLHVAWQLATRMGRALGFEGKQFFEVGVGSERWGGNHRGHREHRDGFTYDIVGLPYKYRSWATDTFKRKPGATPAPGDKKPSSDKGISAFGIPKTASGENSSSAGAPTAPAKSGGPKTRKSSEDGVERFPIKLYAEEGKPNTKITRDENLATKFGELVDKLMNGDPVTRHEDWDEFAATPLLLDESDQPDDDKLRLNLVGHVALALSGVSKWVYASWYEHLFAVRVAAALLAPNKCPAGISTVAPVLRKVIATRDFFWAPEDHYDHWHVVFGAGVQRTDSLGPSHYVPDSDALGNWLLLWDALGVDLEAFRLDLQSREPQHAELFIGLVAERKLLLKLLQVIKTSHDAEREDDRKARAIQRDHHLDLLVKEIRAVTYKDIPSLANEPTFEDWVRNSKLADRYKMPENYIGTHWKAWPSESDATSTPLDEIIPGSTDLDSPD